MLSRTVRWNFAFGLVAAIVGATTVSAQEEKRVQKEPAVPVQKVQKNVEVQEGAVQGQPQREAQPSNNAPSQAYRAKTVLGSKVSIEGNVSIGTVDDIVFADDGYIEYLIVLNENKLVTVPWEAAKFNFEKRTAMVNITQEQFKAVPTYPVNQYPVFTAPDYRVQTYKYYGLTPRQERRAIRRGAVVVP